MKSRLAALLRRLADWLDPHVLLVMRVDAPHGIVVFADSRDAKHFTCGDEFV